MTPAYVLAHTIPAAMYVLPSRMGTTPARAMLLAIGLQESKFTHRVQVGGPARGYWQFERGGGVAGVLTHQTTMHDAWDVCDALGYQTSSEPVYAALADNDTLACCFARLLLWTLPDALPRRDELDKGWRQYLAAWRPGKPHPETWAANWDAAWQLVQP